MEDKENFAKDINVSHKEQIIIDGMDVGGCKYLNTFSDCDGYHYYCDLADDIKNEYCEYYKDCYFKQLVCKTVECEKLKEKFKNFFNIDNQECWDIAFLKDENARYRKALEEIENFMNYEFSGQNEWVKTSILNIIDKVKDGE